MMLVVKPLSSCLRSQPNRRSDGGDAEDDVECGEEDLGDEECFHEVLLLGIRRAPTVWAGASLVWGLSDGDGAGIVFCEFCTVVCSGVVLDG